MLVYIYIYTHSQGETCRNCACWCLQDMLPSIAIQLFASPLACHVGEPCLLLDKVPHAWSARALERWKNLLCTAQSEQRHVAVEDGQSLQCSYQGFHLTRSMTLRHDMPLGWTRYQRTRGPPLFRPIFALTIVFLLVSEDWLALLSLAQARWHVAEASRQQIEGMFTLAWPARSEYPPAHTISMFDRRVPSATLYNYTKRTFQKLWMAGGSIMAFAVDFRGSGPQKLPLVVLRLRAWPWVYRPWFGLAGCS